MDKISSNNIYTVSANQQAHPGPLPSSHTNITSTVNHQAGIHQVANRATLQYQPQLMSTIGANTRSQPVAEMIQQQQRLLYGSSTVGNSIQHAGKLFNMQPSVYNQSAVQSRGGVSNHTKLPLLQPKPTMTSSLTSSQMIVNPMNQLMVKNPQTKQTSVHGQQGVSASQMRQQGNTMNQLSSAQSISRPSSQHTSPSHQQLMQPMRPVQQGLSVNAALNQVLMSAATTKSVPQRGVHIQPAGTVHHHSVDASNVGQLQQNQLLQQLKRQTATQQVTLPVQSPRVNVGYSTSVVNSSGIASQSQPLALHRMASGSASAASQLVDSVMSTRHLSPQPHIQQPIAVTSTPPLTQWPHLQPKQTQQMSIAQQPIVHALQSSVNQVVQQPGRPIQGTSGIQQVRHAGTTSVQTSGHQSQLQARQTLERSSLQTSKPPPIQAPLQVQPQVLQQLQQQTVQQTPQQQRQLVNSLTSQPLKHEATPIVTSVLMLSQPQLQTQSSHLQTIQPAQQQLQPPQRAVTTTSQNVQPSHTHVLVHQAQLQQQTPSVASVVRMSSQPQLQTQAQPVALRPAHHAQQEPMRQLHGLQQHQVRPNVSQVMTIVSASAQTAQPPANATIHHTQTQQAKPKSLTQQLQATPQVTTMQQPVTQQSMKVTSSVQQLPVVQLQTIQTSRQGQSSSVQQLRLVTSSGSSFQLPSNQQQVTLIQLQPGQQGQSFQTQTADGKVLQFRLVTGGQTGSLSNVRPVLLQGGNVKTVLTSGVPFQTKAVKRPASETLAGQPVKLPTGIHGALYRQKQAVLQPNCKTAFTSVDDAVSRLLPYHICDQPDADPAAQTFDQVFDVVSKQLVSRRNQMFDKYRMLLFKEAQCNAPSSEKVMVARMFLSDEKQRLAHDKQQLSDEKQTIVKEMNADREGATETTTEAASGSV